MSLLDEYQFNQMEQYYRECEDAEREEEIEKDRCDDENEED